MMKLTCTVQEVFPANLFQILWMDGEREMHSEFGSFSNGTKNLTSVYSYRIDRKDQGKLITCKVLLDMHGVPATQVAKTASTTLSIHCKSRLFLCSFKVWLCLGFLTLRSFYRSPQSDQDYCQPSDRVEGRRNCEHFLRFWQLSSGAYGAEQGVGRHSNRVNRQWRSWNIVYPPFGWADGLWLLCLSS